MKRAITVVAIILIIGVAAGAYYMRRGSGEPTVNTAPISRGEIIDTVSATGTLQAVTTVQVGSQVSGNIQWLGADFNSIVKKGQVIARIDPSIFQAQVEQSKANLVRSRSDQVKAAADVEHAKVALTDAQQKYTRTKELAGRNLLPQSDLDAAKIAVDSAQAQLQSSQAALQSAQAQVAQAQATLNQNQVNLEHCIITTPIDGIVTQRNVDVGQTVAASLQSPTLFVIAADLTKMQVNANIDEADVGRIRPHQTVTFRVDAYPAEEFTGTVEQVRLQPIVVQNVTTYGTIVNVPNPDLKLKPGMTANLKVQIARRNDVLRISNAALRFRPTAEMFSALGQPVPEDAQFGGRGGRGMNGNGRANGGARGAGAPGTSAPGTPAPSAPGTSAPSAPGTSAPGTSAPGTSAPGTSAPVTSAPSGPGASASGTGDREARMMERFKLMSADEQKQFIDRMKSRGMDTSAFEKQAASATAAPPSKGRGTPAAKASAPAAPQAETIDALFGPLPPVESVGRAWMYVNRELKPVRLRLGITDGNNTEVLGGDLQPGTEVVTGMLVSGTTQTRTQGAGNPLMPQRGGPPRGR